MPCRVTDTTGIKVRGEGEWHARKHGGAKRRVWRKVHLAIDEGEEEQERPRWGVSPTNMEVRAVESSLALATGPKEPVDGSGIGDAPMLPSLLSQVPADEPIASVTAPSRDIAPQCPAGQWMAPMTGGPWKKDSRCGGEKRGPAGHKALLTGALAEMEWLPSTQPRRDQASRDIASQCPAGQWMNCMKLLGQKLMSRDFDRQTAEIQIRIALMNRFAALGRDEIEALC